MFSIFAAYLNKNNRIFMRFLSYISILLTVFVMAFQGHARTTAKDNPTKGHGKFVLIIDAGHGGNDTGTEKRDRTMDEKDITLKVALKFGKLVEESCKDVEVIYTRAKDVTLSLPGRAQKAREAKGDLFISIHVNAAPDPSAYGVETYVFGISGKESKKDSEQKRIQDKWNIERENIDFDGKEADFQGVLTLEQKIYLEAQRQKHSAYSKEAAKYVQNALVGAMQTTSYRRHVNNRGVKSANLYVLCYSPMAAILVELGYLSNKREEVFLNTEAGLNACANGIFDGFIRYWQDWKKRRLPSENDNRVEGLVQPGQFQQPETKPAAPSKPAAPVKPVTPATPTTPTTPTTPATPATPATPTTPTTPTKPEPPAKPAKEDRQDVIVYKIQYLSAPKLYSEGDPALKGISPVHYYKDGNVYRYTYGEASSPAALASDMKRIRTLFKDAFIAKFDSKGNRIR